MTFDQFLRIVRARWKLVAWVFALVLLATLIVSLIIPKSYKATSTVVIDSRPDPLSATMSALGGSLPSSILATQVDIINSLHVGQRVVRMLRLTEVPIMRQRWEAETDGKGNYEAWLAEIIGKGLEVRPVRESNVIEIQYEGSEPAFAASVATAYAQAYIDTTVQMRNNPARQYSDFFEERARIARSKLEAAQQKLAAAQRERGIVATEERLDVEMARLADLSSQVLSLKAAQVDTGSRNAQAISRPDQVSEVVLNPLIAGLKADLSRQEARLNELNARFGDAHPTVVEARANIAALRSRIRTETSQLTASVGITNTITSSRVNEAVKAYEAQRAKVLAMKEQRSELSLLENEVVAAQRMYEAIQLRQSQSNLESNTGQAGVVLLNPAVEPTKHSSPRMMLNMIIASVMGMLLGLMGAMAVELFDRRVRSPFDLVHALDLPVIGILPNPNAPKRRLLGRRGFGGGGGPGLAAIGGGALTTAAGKP